MKYLEDYYYSPEGLTVFTESYHLKRGYCCGSKCFHCPYDGINVEDSSAVKELNSFEILCPFCFETFALPANPQDGSVQNFVYDCEICCNPIDLTLHFKAATLVSIDIEKSN